MRLPERHPLGSAVDALEAALVAEGLEVEGGGWGIVCRPVGLVRWEAAGRLAGLEGERDAIRLQGPVRQGPVRNAVTSMSMQARRRAVMDCAEG